MKVTLEDNQVAILDYSTREVDIITIVNLDDVEDLESTLYELGYDLSNILYMA
jgi:aspartokinase